MSEIALGRFLRTLLGVVGTAALVAGSIVGGTELRIAAGASGYWPAGVAAAACALIAYGCALLLRGALRGRIAVRRPRS